MKILSILSGMNQTAPGLESGGLLAGVSAAEEEISRSTTGNTDALIVVSQDLAYLKDANLTSSIQKITDQGSLVLPVALTLYQTPDPAPVASSNSSKQFTISGRFDQLSSIIRPTMSAICSHVVKG